MKVSEVLKLLTADGWELKRVRGSHRQLVRPTKSGKVTVAGKPSVTVPTGHEVDLETGGLAADG